MKTTSLLCAVAAVTAFAGPADAIYKCTTAKGIVYQDRPCREGNETDVQIVIPTGEVAPRIPAAADEGAQATGARVDNRAGAPKTGRTSGDGSTQASGPGNENRTNAPRSGRTSGDDPASAAKPAGTKTSEPAANATDSLRKKDTRTSAENTAVPLTAEEARNTDPSAKYYASESFGPGGETPAQMNCESPTGERRVFYLSNGKLTSI